MLLLSCSYKVFCRLYFGKFSCQSIWSVQKTFITPEEIPSDSMKIRNININESKFDGQGFMNCDCTTTCKSKKCKFKKNEILCNSKCHNAPT